MPETTFYCIAYPNETIVDLGPEGIRLFDVPYPMPVPNKGVTQVQIYDEKIEEQKDRLNFYQKLIESHLGRKLTNGCVYLRMTINERQFEFSELNPDDPREGALIEKLMSVVSTR